MSYGTLSLRNRLLAVTIGLVTARNTPALAPVAPEPIEPDAPGFGPELAAAEDARVIAQLSAPRRMTIGELESPPVTVWSREALSAPHREPIEAETPDEHDDRLDRAAEAELEHAKGTTRDPREPLRQFWPRTMRQTPLYHATRAYVAGIYLS